MDFAAFLLVTVLLLVRPQDFLEQLQEVPVYQAAMFACLAINLPKVLRQLRPGRLRVEPVTVCVLALIPAVLLSNLFRPGRMGESFTFTLDFVKSVIYYLLLIAVVNTPGRLRFYLKFLVACLVLMTLLALLQLYELVDLPALRALQIARMDVASMELNVTVRLRYTGIYNDPNDFCLVLAVGALVSLSCLMRKRSGARRVVWLLPLALFGFAILLTQSRGGLVGLAVGLLLVLRHRVGWRKAVLICGLALPLVAVVIGGRMAHFSPADQEDEGSAQSRIALWSNGVLAIRQHPLFGVGSNYFEEEVGDKHVAHNSFVHSTAELGLLGGLFFTGVVYLSLRLLWRSSARGVRVVDRELAYLRPYVLAMVACYAVGLFFLSRCYVAPTYLIFGLALVFARLCKTEPRLPPLRFNLRLFRRLALVEVGMLVFVYAIVRILAPYTT
jgi:O-antigen ligase